MEHKSCYCIFLIICCATGVFIQHIIPIVGRLIEVSSQVARVNNSISVWITITIIIKLHNWLISMTSCSLFRPLPVIHYLSHGCSHTTRVSFTYATGSIGSKCPIWIILIPCGFNQRTNNGIAFCFAYTFFESRPLCCYFFVLSSTICLNFGDELVILTQPSANVNRLIVRAECTGVRISEDRRNNIICGYHDPAFAICILVYIILIL